VKFSEISKFWRGEDLLNQALDETNRMFSKNEKMFAEASEALTEEKKTEMDIYKEDQKVNKYEIDIRKKILEHLTINPEQDVAACLILAGVVRDIERLGDFSKNIIELSLMYKKKFPNEKYFNDLRKIRSQVMENFKLAREAFKESDENKALMVMRTHKTIAEKCENILREIVNDKRIETKKAVICVLFSRYLKRIDAHLMNIASSVVNPFHRIRYRADYIEFMNKIGEKLK
jgi:Na+/phosphate symporter